MDVTSNAKARLKSYSVRACVEVESAGVQALADFRVGERRAARAMISSNVTMRRKQPKVQYGGTSTLYARVAVDTHRTRWHSARLRALKRCAAHQGVAIDPRDLLASRFW
jgi:hypothetical protein